MDNSLLKKFAFGRSKFLTLKDGEELVAKFVTFDIVPNHFDGGETECIRYTLEINGVEKFWESSSGKLADQMVAISPGDTISIKRTGIGNNTKYIITKIEK